MLAQVAEWLGGSTAGPEEKPLLYWKGYEEVQTNNDISTQDTVSQSESEPERDTLFRQCKVNNWTDCAVQMCSTTYDYCFANVGPQSSEFCDLSDNCAQASFVVFEPDDVVNSTKLYSIPLGRPLV